MIPVKTKQTLVSPGHDKQLPDHAAALSNVLLHQLTARDPDEGAVCVVGHRPGQQGLTRTRGAVQQDTLGMQHELVMECSDHGHAE